MNAPKTLTTDECNLLLEALLAMHGTTSQVRRGIRNHAIALVLLDAGLRTSEAAGLKIADLVFQGKPVTSLVVRPEIAKNHRERQIPIGTRLSEALNDMLLHFWSPVVANSGAFAFTSGRGNKPIGRRQVHRIISAAAVAAFGRSVYPHILRHTFASRLMRVTNIRTVQELLGHKNVASTQIYTHPNEQDKHQAIEKMDLDEAD
ncbi:Tyrosine recombinase XerD [subsurface metagenome]